MIVKTPAQSRQASRSHLGQRLVPGGMHRCRLALSGGMTVCAPARAIPGIVPRHDQQRSHGLTRRRQPTGYPSGSAFPRTAEEKIPSARSAPAVPNPNASMVAAPPKRRTGRQRFQQRGVNQTARKKAQRQTQAGNVAGRAGGRNQTTRGGRRKLDAIRKNLPPSTCAGGKDAEHHQAGEHHQHARR